MTDWNKLKVTELKVELKQRGLAQTGVKAALVARLEESEKEDGSESEATIQGDPARLDAAADSPDTVSPVLPSGDGLPEPTAQPHIEDVIATIPKVDSPRRDEALDRFVDETDREDVLQAPAEPTHTTETAQLAESRDHHLSALPSVEPQEANDDRQKRKRRSQSPPPSAADARKRLKADEGGDSKEEIVTPKEDAQWVEKHNAVDSGEINAETMEIDSKDNGQPGTTTLDVSKGENEIEIEVAKVKVEAQPMEVDSKAEEPPIEQGDSPHRTRDSRFKNLFGGESSGGTAMAISASRDSGHDEAEPDRIITPAIHPATAAIYITQIMRPLNPAQFKAHLAALAAPPGRDTEPEVIVGFYLDPIRTHAFVSFTSVSAASRVRSALHDRIWPDEKTRKPLWVDFIPLEKMEDWVEQEQEESTGGRGRGKKWEVRYDVGHDRSVTAILQEATGNAQPPRQPSIANTGVGIHPSRQALVQPARFDPPSGPRSSQVREPRPIPGTKRLDELFKSTTAKPVLYWLPVSKDVADRRLDNIDRALSKEGSAGRAIEGEIRRYTFEDTDKLVDRGPEIFSGIRPPPGHRAPRNPGHRGGGYRGGRGSSGPAYDSYRSDRGPDRGFDRRGSRDDRRY